MDEAKRKKILGIWFVVGVGMLLGQIILGGITRLTGSGLSITEWKAILGAFPPTNEQDWTIAFIKYQQYGQYKLVNTSMTLSQFKHIYFWEWFHRLWARITALAAIIPLLYFMYKKIVFKADVIKIVIAIVLGGVAGAVGWIMVKKRTKTRYRFSKSGKFDVAYFSGNDNCSLCITHGVRVSVSQTTPHL